jgi:hypothetical protein
VVAGTLVGLAFQLVLVHRVQRDALGFATGWWFRLFVAPAVLPAVATLAVAFGIVRLAADRSLVVVLVAASLAAAAGLVVFALGALTGEERRAAMTAVRRVA